MLIPSWRETNGSHGDPSVFEIAVRRGGLVPTMEQAVGMPSLLGEKGRDSAELARLPIGVEMHCFVDEGADQRPVALPASAAYRSQHFVQLYFMLLL